MPTISQGRKCHAAPDAHLAPQATQRPELSVQAQSWPCPCPGCPVSARKSWYLARNSPGEACPRRGLQQGRWGQGLVPGAQWGYLRPKREALRVSAWQGHLGVGEFSWMEGQGTLASRWAVSSCVRSPGLLPLWAPPSLGTWVCATLARKWGRWLLRAQPVPALVHAEEVHVETARDTWEGPGPG